MKAAIIDTETTNLDDPEVIELAILSLPPGDDLFSDNDRIPNYQQHGPITRQRFQPSKPSTYGALSVHHILPSELEGMPPSSEAKIPDDVDYIIGHNVDHDWKALGSPEVKRICTYALAQHVFPDADSYSQSALLYLTMGANEHTRGLLRNAHSAAQDVENCLELLYRIIDAAPAPLTTWPELYEYSEQCRIPLKMPITAARGELLTDIDDGLLDWCLRQSWLPEERPYLYEGLRLESQRRCGGS